MLGVLKERDSRENDNAKGKFFHVKRSPWMEKRFVLEVNSGPARF